MNDALAPEYPAFVRQLRRDQTDPEKLLWYSLRNCQLFGLKFRRQYPVGSYVLDFYCHQYRLCVELDGGQHYEGARYTARRKTPGVPGVTRHPHPALQQQRCADSTSKQYCYRLSRQ